MPQSPASPESSPRSFDFGDLGRSRPRAQAADATGELDELCADDILESDDIAPLEAAAEGIQAFEAPPVDPSDFDVAELETFDEIEVEGLGARPTLVSSAPAPSAVIARPGPIAMTGESLQYEAPKVALPTSEAAATSMTVEYTSPSPSALIGVPPAPVTSPLHLESVVVDDAGTEKTLEIRGNDLAKVAAAAAALDANEPQKTEVLKRSDMPAALNTPTLRGAMVAAHTPSAAAVYTPSFPMHAGQPQRGRASSIAPVALDVAALPRPTMPSIPGHGPMPGLHAASASAPARRGMSGLAIGGIVFAAVAFIGFVGVGGFAASRALSAGDKTESASVTPAPAAIPAPAVDDGNSAAAGAQPASEAPTGALAATGAAADSTSPATLDVASLPSAPVPGSAPRGFAGAGNTGSSSTVSGLSSSPSTRAPAPRANGGSPLAAPGQIATPSGIKTTALPPPGAAAGSTPLPPPAAAPVAAPAAGQSSTGTVRVDPSLRAVVVDGSYRRATDGVLTVSCGTHRIKAGMKEQQTVNVPCGGSVSL